MALLVAVAAAFAALGSGAPRSAAAQQLIRVPAPQATVLPLLVEADGWPAPAAATINAYIAGHGAAARGYDPRRPPVAVFDWDNTVIYNDIGAATVRWMIEHGLVRQPPDADWARTSRYLTEAAAQALAAACGADVPPGERLPTDTDADCARALLGLYDGGELPAGAPAFAGYDHRRLRGTTSWQQVLLTGYTPDEARAIAASVLEAHLGAPLGATRTVGGVEVAGSIRVQEPVRRLITVLQANGFDIWVVSASPQPVVEAAASLVGVEPDRVIGIRAVLDADGRYSYDLQGCGDVATGENSVLTYIEGKRCWINQVIYGLEGREAFRAQREPSLRPAIVAGDATTDVDMLRDATGLRIVFDRHYDELMCYALAGEGAPWVTVDPFVVAPAPRETPYPCSSSACLARDGSRGPCLSDSGALLPDQPPR